jgi:hypothetical protein
MSYNYFPNYAGKKWKALKSIYGSLGMKIKWNFHKKIFQTKYGNKKLYNTPKKQIYDEFIRASLMFSAMNEFRSKVSKFIKREINKCENVDDLKLLEIIDSNLASDWKKLKTVFSHDNHSRFITVYVRLTLDDSTDSIYYGEKFQIFTNIKIKIP